MPIRKDYFPACNPTQASGQDGFVVNIMNIHRQKAYIKGTVVGQAVCLSTALPLENTDKSDARS